MAESHLGISRPIREEGVSEVDHSLEFDFELFSAVGLLEVRRARWYRIAGAAVVEGLIQTQKINSFLL